jgi:peptidyl-prolyl cis-trans isomerase B (cyclophilin B)
MKSIITYSFFICIFALFGCNQPAAKTEIPEEETFQKVEMITTLGTMEIQLSNETPLHRDNFIHLAKHHAYDSLLFHRVIQNFMIQGGDPDSRKATLADTLGDGDAPYLVKAEFNKALFHKKGVLAAARDDNPDRSSSSMQFYIVQGKVFNDSTLDLAQNRIHKNFAVDYFKELGTRSVLLDSMDSAMDQRNFEHYNLIKDSIYGLATADASFKPYMIPEEHREVYKTLGGTPHLDQTYTVFGEVTKGLEVLDAIAAVETDDMNRPLKDARIISLKIIE